MGILGRIEFGWIRASAIIAVLSCGLVACDMLLRIEVPSYTKHQLGRIPYIGRGCVRGFDFNESLAFMNIELSVAFALIFILILTAAAVAVYACGGYRLPAVAVAGLYDVYSLFAIAFVLVPMFGGESWTSPAVFDAGFVGGIIAVLCGAYGVSLLAFDESVPD